MGGGASGLAPDEPTFDAKAGQPAGEQLDQKQVMLGKKLLSKLAGPDEVVNEGADVNAITSNRETALKLASDAKQADLVAWLRERGAVDLTAPGADANPGPAALDPDPFDDILLDDVA